MDPCGCNRWPFLQGAVARRGNVGWSLYGAPWLQPVATGGKSDRSRRGQNKPKPLLWVATRCGREYMVGRASAVDCHPLREVSSLRRRGSTSFRFGRGYRLLLHSGHGHWSQPQPVQAMRIMARF
jgi:hypothetical protein